MQSFTLREATTVDIPVISNLADTIWKQVYTSIISMEQITYMLNNMYNKESLLEQIKQKGHRFFLLENESGAFGFISVNPEQAGDWFLNKFYINQNSAGKGIGSRAFDQLLTIIHPNKIRLTVNRQNYKAINFYFKKGFTIERVADFDIGNGFVMNDFVMIWK